MGMELEVLTPGMKNGKDADACAKAPWISGDLQQSLRSCAKQHRIEELLVAQCNRRQLFRDGKDCMDVGHRQQAASLLQQPSIPR
jgi:hypothetical protein